MGLRGARRHEHQRRHPQIRLLLQGRLGAAAPRPGQLREAVVVRRRGVGWRALRIADARGHPAPPADRRRVGGASFPWRGRLPGDGSHRQRHPRPAAAWHRADRWLARHAPTRPVDLRDRQRRAGDRRRRRRTHRGGLVPRPSTRRTALHALAIPRQGRSRPPRRSGGRCNHCARGPNQRRRDSDVRVGRPDRSAGVSAPWLGDACSLVEAYRSGELTPADAVDAVIEAAESDPYNAICNIDADRARQAAAGADVTKPFGGVPFAVKELEMVEGWPYAYGTKLLEGTIGSYTMVHVERIRDLGGAIPVVQTTSSEMGLVGYTSTKVHGTTTNPWDTTRTPGGSSGGTAAAVSGGLVPIGTGTDGGGSIRIPAAYTGLVGFKTSFRRIPFAPFAQMEPLTSTVGCLSRSVRDTARWLDVANGAHPRDPFSLPRVEGFEAGLGSYDLAGLRVAVLPDFGGAVVHPDVVAAVEDAAAALIEGAGLKRLDLEFSLPDMGAAWIAPALPVMWAGAGAFWPDIREMVTTEVAGALDLAAGYDIAMAAAIDPVRKQLNEAVATLFEQVG